MTYETDKSVIYDPINTPDVLFQFIENVQVTDTCWRWKRSPLGCYGNFYMNGKSYVAHRFAYAVTFGPFPAWLYVCHHCDNPHCVRPDHLFLGTQKDNMRDKVAKGRHNPSKFRCSRKS